ncbi:MAG: lysoplasmalogenase [Acidobacteria bacterium]|nr:lysoplasmalogenase [Acidobacteriota bacterium]
MSTANEPERDSTRRENRGTTNRIPAGAFLTFPVVCSLGFAVSATVTVAAHALGRRSLVYVFKPLATALLLLLVATGPSGFSSPYATAILGGLFFSLLGDIFLMFPADRFRSGLFSFLLAHACYVLAFTRDSPFATPPLPFVLCLAAGGAVLPALWSGIPRRLRPHVVAYVALLLVMAGQAASRAAHLHAASALQAFLGAALFVLSDSLLAWNRFRRPFPAAQALIHATYFPAQWLIAISTTAA